jgi:aspartyl protease family protein
MRSDSLLGKVLIIMLWCGLTLVVTILYRQWTLGQYNPNLQPTSHQYRSGTKEVTLERNRYGHYISSGKINGIDVVFLLDTGSTQVAIPGHLAEALQLDYGEKLETATANGTIWVYDTELSHLSLGNIEMTGVSASINPHMQEPEILLGMSVLKHLDFYQRGNQLKLQQFPKGENSFL